jgi:cyanophycin synthetase
MRVIDSRRLRGPNLQTKEPAAVAEVALSPGERPGNAEASWRRHALRMASALGWRREATRAVARRFRGGMALALPAPIDMLLLATEVNEWAIAAATWELHGDEGGSGFEDALARFRRAAARDARPRLVALRREALRRGVAFLWDDDIVTLGMARASKSFAMNELPPPGKVPWGRLGAIPVALVTGTNGKTTTSRLVARMAKLAGLVAGSTSTDGIAVDGRVVEPGDWTGAEAARNVLRRPEVQIAILETARGGILRRGLGLDACDAALVTNVASDHLGEFGVADLATMARTKAVVAAAVRKGGKVVLNADDRRLMALAPEMREEVVLFGLSTNPVVRAHLRGGGVAFVQREGWLVRAARGREMRLLRVDEVPLAFGGAAVHNVANALAAAALAWALRLPDDAVTQALRTFGAHPADNPGRGHYEKLASGVGVLLDFGHNAAGLRLLFGLARSLLGSGGRLLVVATQPGDRTPADFTAFAREIARVHPRLVVVWESVEYLRGREPGQVIEALRRALLEEGVPPTSLATSAAGEVPAVDRAVRAARPGDVVVVAPQIDREGVRRLLRARPRATSRRASLA